MSRPRIKTGCEGLDEVLHGGFPTNSLNVLMGAPGSGKSILAQQLVFTNATPEHPALYLTTLSEPLEKFFANSQGYTFFDGSKVGVSVFYEDLGQMVREHGYRALPDVIAEMLAQRRPKVLVIDSFKSLAELGEGVQEQRTVLFDCASLLANFDCTTFLVGEWALETMTELPAFAIADSILWLERRTHASAEQRFLRVEKLRGSASIAGIHAFRISESGLEVFPRILTPEMPPSYTVKVQRVHTGVAGLDGMIEKGFWRGSTTLVAGPTGAGKTLLGLQFLHAGAQAGEPGIYVGFQENPEQLRGLITPGFNWDLPRLESAGLLELFYRSPIEMQLDEVAHELLRRVRGGKIRRVVIDALGDLKRRSFDADRFVDYIYALTQWFAINEVTCLITYELRELFEFHTITNEDVSTMADNVLLLRFGADHEMVRTVRIVKTRGSAHDQHERVLEISAQGVAVGHVRAVPPGRDRPVSAVNPALLKRLTEINRRISGSLDFDEVLTLIAKNARDLLERQACLVVLADEDERLKVRACQGVERALCEGFVGTVDESVIEKLSSHLGLSPEHAVSAVPILVNDTLRGVLVVVGDTPLDSNAVWLLSALADQAAIALGNARMHEAVITQERRLSETVRELEAFTYSVAHDLRAPARSIAGFSSLLQEELSGRADPAVQEYLQRIMAGVIRMDGLIRDLLAWSHLARVDVKVERVDLGSVVTAARQQLEADILERGARVDVASPLPAVSAHRGMLVQAIANLLSNAIKFVAAGIKPRVIVRAEPRDGRVRVWVEDNGIGIERTHYDRIFGTFERLNRMEDYTGTGIGLAIVRRSVERMGGRCGLESILGQGSRFWIELKPG